MDDSVFDTSNKDIDYFLDQAAISNRKIAAVLMNIYNAAGEGYIRAETTTRNGAIRKSTRVRHPKGGKRRQREFVEYLRDTWELTENDREFFELMLEDGFATNEELGDWYDNA